MTTVKTPKQILLDAAAILEEEGKWTQGEWHEACETNPDGVSHCADGAITVAAGITTITVARAEDGAVEITQRHLARDGEEAEAVYQAYEEAYDAASTYARGLTGLAGGIIHYNDEDGRKQEEVVAALRGAAQTL